jgi:hypothetical protein
MMLMMMMMMVMMVMIVMLSRCTGYKCALVAMLCGAIGREKVHGFNIANIGVNFGSRQLPFGEVGAWGL